MCREFPAQMASNAENVPIWWRHHAMEDRNMLILQSQYHACWRPEDARSQGIHSHDIDLFLPARGLFLKRWSPSTVWLLVLSKYHHRGCLNNPIFSNFELYAACWARFMCHHELCSTPGSHPFSFNSSLGLAGRKHCQKITIYRLWLHGLYGLHIPRCLLSEKVRQI